MAGAAMQRRDAGAACGAGRRTSPRPLHPPALMPRACRRAAPLHRLAPVPTSHAAPTRLRRTAVSVAAVAAVAVHPPTVATAAQLVAAAALPVGKVALMCVVGALAASKGLLPPEGRRCLSSLALQVFTPCLLFSKLAVGVGLGEVARLWVVSANMVLSHVVGLLLGLAAVRLAAVPPRLRRQVVISCGVGNVGNLPFILLAGLATDPALPFAAALGPATAAELALRYVALSNLTAALIQFPLTFLGLQREGGQAAQPASEGSAQPGQLQQQQQPHPHPHPHHHQQQQQQQRQPGESSAGSSAAAGTSASSPGSPAADGVSAAALAASQPAPAPPAPPSQSGHPGEQRRHMQQSSGPDPGDGMGPAAAAAPPSTAPTATAAAPPCPPPPPPPPAPAVARWRSLLSGVLTPPTLASLLAVAVASVDGARNALFAPTGGLRLVGEVAEALGACCIPVLLLVLGANLSRGPGVAAGRLPAGAVVAALATRLFVLPAVCGGLLLGAWSAGLLPSADPLAMLVMLVMHATPTAVLVHSMATIFRNAEDEVAALLFWQYAAALVSLPLAVGAALAVLAPAAATPEAWGLLGGGLVVVPAAHALGVGSAAAAAAAA